MEGAPTLVDLFLKGGPMMWPLLGCSLIALAVIFERSLYFARLRFDQDRYRRDLGERLLREDLAGAAHLSADIAHPVARVARVYLENLARAPALLRSLLAREGSYALSEAEKRLRVISTVAHISPFMGLLGTVAGMVQAFARIESLDGAVEPSQLAGGIWEALLTTLFGLAIAIPCVVALQYFHSRTDRIAREMEAMVTTLDEWRGGRKHGEPHVGP